MQQGQALSTPWPLVLFWTLRDAGHASTWSSSHGALQCGGSLTTCLCTGTVAQRRGVGLMHVSRTLWWKSVKKVRGPLVSAHKQNQFQVRVSVCLGGNVCSSVRSTGLTLSESLGRGSVYRLDVAVSVKSKSLAFCQIEPLGVMSCGRVSPAW